MYADNFSEKTSVQTTSVKKLQCDIFVCVQCVYTATGACVRVMTVSAKLGKESQHTSSLEPGA